MCRFLLDEVSLDDVPLLEFLSTTKGVKIPIHKKYHLLYKNASFICPSRILGAVYLGYF